MKYEVRCHESGDDCDYLVEEFATLQEAKDFIAKRDEERPDDFLYEHWYVVPVQKSSCYCNLWEERYQGGESLEM